MEGASGGILAAGWMKYHVANCAREHGKQQLHHQANVTAASAQEKLDNFIETVKLLWGAAVINPISLHYRYLYCLGVWLWKDC